MHAHGKRFAPGLVAAFLLTSGPAFAQQIGTTAAVAPDARGRPPGGTERTLAIGMGMTRDERVVTDAAGRTQILFTDGSTISVGPSSTLVLDKYVFDPDAGRGQLAVTLSKGVIRFVGGKISKSDTVTIETPIATIGIRGGVAQIEYSSRTGLTAHFLFGDVMSVTALGTTRTTTAVGTAIDVQRGTPPGMPRPVTSRELAATSQRLAGPGAPRQTRTSGTGAIESHAAALSAGRGPGGSNPLASLLQGYIASGLSGYSGAPVTSVGLPVTTPSWSPTQYTPSYTYTGP